MDLDWKTFMQDSVDYLGHRIDAQGVRTSPSKVEAITKAPGPNNVTELQSFLEMVNYYGKFYAICQHSWIHYMLSLNMKPSGINIGQMSVIMFSNKWKPSWVKLQYWYITTPNTLSV